MWFEESGILCSIEKPVTLTVENFSTAFAVMQRITKGKRFCLMNDLQTVSAPDKEVRDLITRLMLTAVIAQALITPSMFSKMIANIYLALKKQPFPIRMFNTEREARVWLKQFLEKTNAK
ncbi:MAG TPA: hypothetical protein VI731_06535 [Bacteroidia bacterium]|nr:hypothetical protein [Bacteroidia bacterium]